MTSTQTNSRSAHPSSVSGSRGTHRSANKRYYIEGEIGEGATSTVYRAIDRVAGNRNVALKVLQLEIPGEWETLVRLQHTSIVQVRDVGRISDPKNRRVIRPYIAMDLESGAPLSSDLREHRKLTESIDIIKSCGRAIAYLHENGIGHFDIKPSNIFIARSPLGHLNGAKVLDFGLAAPLLRDGIKHDGGTYAYMSPEQISRQVVTDLSDVFSLGVVAYELLTGRHPFTTDGGVIDLSLLQRLITSGIARFACDVDPSVPEHVALVVHKMLAKDPTDRPSARQLVDLLDRREVFEDEKRQLFHTHASPNIPQIEEALAAGQLDAAEKQLQALQLRGWAFAEIVRLHDRILAARADAFAVERLTAANQVLSAGDIPGARNILAVPEFGRQTCDVRLLEFEARLELHERNHLDAKLALDQARLRIDAGAFREGEWFIGLARGVESFDALATSGLSADLAAIEQALVAAEEAERKWLAARLDSDLPQPRCNTLAVQAITHDRAAKRLQSTLRSVLDLLEHADDEGRASQVLRADRADNEGDGLRATLDHVRQKEVAVQSLRERLAAWNNDHTIAVAEALQAVEDLLKVGRTRQLENQRAELSDLFESALAEELRRRVLMQIDDLCRIGAWKSAHRCIQGLAKRDASTRLSAIETSLASAVERDRLIEAALVAQRECRPDDAIDSLRAAVQADPRNRVLIVALAASLLARATTEGTRHERAKAAQTRAEALALLDSNTGTEILDGRSQQLRQFAMQPEIERTPRAPGSNRTPAAHRPPDDVNSLRARWTVAHSWLRARGASAVAAFRQHAVITACSAIAILLFGVGLHLSFASSRQPASPLEPPGRAAAVTLSLAVTPATATVQIDGQVTPREDASLSPGSHSLVITAAGYEPLSETIEATGTQLQLARTLTPLPTQLQLTSNVAATSAQLDARDLGDPLSIGADDANHTLTAAFPAAGRVRIGFTPGVATQPRVTVLDAQNAAPVVVSSFGDRITIFSPKPVKVAFNGGVKGHAGPRGLTIMRPSGDTDAVLTIGEDRERFDITIPMSDAPLLRVHTTVASDLSSILITANQDDSLVVVDGQPRGSIKRGRLLLQALKSGAHAVSISHPDYCATPTEAPVVLPPSRQVEVKFTFERPTIRFSEAPAGARIAVNGTEIAASAIPALIGTNTITASAPGYRDFNQQLQVRCGDEPTVTLAMEMRRDGPRLGTIALSLAPSGTVAALYRQGQAGQEQLVSSALRTPADVDPGEYRLHLTANGYWTKDVMVSVKAGQTGPVPDTLVRIEQTWAPTLATQKNGSQRARATSVLGDADASGTYSFRLLRQGLRTRRFFGTWVVGYRSAVDYIEVRVDDGQLQWKRTRDGDFVTIGELSDLARKVADKNGSIYVRVHIRGASITHEIGGDERTLTPVGSPVELQEGRFAVTKDSQISDFAH